MTVNFNARPLTKALIFRIQKQNMHYSNSKYWDFCAPVAGILLTLSFAPFDYSWLALAAMAFLFAAWRGCSAKRAALRGYLFGLGAFGSGVSWVYISMHDFGGAGALESSLLTAVFAAFWALFPALAGYLSVKMKGPGQVILTPVIWMLVEYLRGYWVLNGFPWLQLAYSQLETPLAGYIPVLGAYGAGFIAALTASIAVEICRGKKRLLLITALTILWGTGALLRNQTWTHEIGQPIRVSMIQGNIAQDQKWRPENKINTLLKYKRMTEEHWDSNVIIWPETAIPAYLDQVQDAFLAPLANDAKLHNTDLIISVPVQETAPVKNFNAVITLGKEQGMYRKTHLLPFGEYLPLQPLSGFVLDLINIRLGNFTPGTATQPLLKAGGYPFITLICYEDVFGDLSVRGLPDAAFLVNVTNDGWFGDSIEPHQHMQMARMRAIETGRFLLRSTNTGMTGIVSSKGEIVGQAPLFQETALTGTINPMGGMTPYARWGDRPVIGLMVVLLLGLLGYGKVNVGRISVTAV
ncbi:apolipoprotein N-acyltransferase [Methylobacter tundripaludum]|uniref:Apolipoprotein N-acyltransferase n=2 Tax=Methylobacter tundripaludum TaxID=173365 RepID=A0A2S6H4G7_9GAMM|nr:apolipoprotein N-acyltransferase [Methylobacter tundripaludum]